MSSFAETLRKERRERLERIAGAAVQPAAASDPVVQSVTFGVRKKLRRRRETVVAAAIHPELDYEQCWSLEIAGTEWVPTVGVSTTAIQRAVCEHFGIKRADMLSSRRHQDVTVPRHVAMYLCKTLTTRSYPSIGRAFGGRDHTTVLHATRKIAQDISRDAKVAASVKTLTHQLVM